MSFATFQRFVYLNALYDISLSFEGSPLIGCTTFTFDHEATVDGSGTVTYPSTRTYIDWHGYLADFPFDAAINSVYKTNMTIQRSGARGLHKKS